MAAAQWAHQQWVGVGSHLLEEAQEVKVDLLQEGLGSMKKGKHMLGCSSAAMGRPLHPVVRFSSRSLPSPQLSMPLSSQTRLRGIHFPFLQLKYGSPLHSDWLKPDRHGG